MKIINRMLCLVAMATSIINLQAQCLNGDCENGKGTYIYESGAKYTGDFKKGIIQGKGTLWFSNGNVYTGDWNQQYRDGKGKFSFSTGDVYEGDMRLSKFKGQGTMTYANGDKYTGQWDNDLPNGKGIYTYKNKQRYEGVMLNGRFEGQGKMIYPDGTIYDGNFVNSQKNGFGTLTYPNKKKQSGQWANGNFIGASNTTASNSKPNAKPTNGNKPNASGTAASGSSKPTPPPMPVIQQRNCNDDYCSSGTGIYTYGDGSRWEGEFFDGEPRGKGTLYYANGDKYIGNFREHSPDGEGVMYYVNGRSLGAVWSLGKPTGTIIPNDKKIVTNTTTKPTTSTTRPTTTTTTAVKIWAVIVGVGRYQHMPTLKYTDDDAYQMFAFLKSPAGGSLSDEQVRLLIDEEATRESILNAIQQTFAKADANDVVMFYFSGHGIEGAFLPVDFDGFNNQLRHEDVKALLNNCVAKHKVCIADACHSGSIVAQRAPMSSQLQRYYSAFETTKGGLALLMSSKSEEFSLEDHGLRSGIFSHYLIKGLKGEADSNRNKIITITEIFDYLYTNVRTYTGNVQTPVLSGQHDANMPVGTLP